MFKTFKDLFLHNREFSFGFVMIILVLGVASMSFFYAICAIYIYIVNTDMPPYFQ